jgi:hypothetical protein
MGRGEEDAFWIFHRIELVMRYALYVMRDELLADGD